MDGNQQADNPEQERNPTELLYAQTQSLSELVDIQRIQNNQITELQSQNERIVGLLDHLLRKDVITEVEVENFNMPFFDLIGFIIKVSLASIPVGIFWGVIYFVLSIILLG